MGRTWAFAVAGTLRRVPTGTGYNRSSVTGSLESAWDKRGASAWLLSPLGGLYALGWWSYQAVYALGLKRPYEPHCPVVTVGNLVAGGSGKTPLSLHLASTIASLGHRVVLSMSGYGAPRSHDATLAPAGEISAREWGDEPAMVRWLAPELPLVVGRDRVEAARLAHAADPDCVLLLDDGFQHLRLRQHVPIVLDAPGSNRFCLPAGPYREPRSTGLARARLVLPGGEFRVERNPVQFRQVNGGVQKLEEAAVMCAIARPARFWEAVSASGVAVRQFSPLPDHDPLTAGTLFAGLDSGLPLVVTAKDWVKLRERDDLGERPVFVALSESRVEPRDAFQSWLGSEIDGFVRQTSA
ncbi:MAG: tetraacyldisaccharide 4'-kinase [Armatimonadetes bacterium]|nr:tetraacyldisaccharide 4'-kinase [Armatimonadota bacterium]